MVQNLHTEKMATDEISKEVPGSICTFPFGGARIREIKALKKSLDECNNHKRAFQKLPRHMQRRTVSSNPQRLPRSIRYKHSREISNNKIKITKRPSRKYRRKPKNFLENYNQRQKGHVWMQTHIWHAKHFHMVERWGFMLPKSPTNKCYRATIRAATNTCSIQDVSYDHCFEIEGSLEDLLNLFVSITTPEEYIILKQFFINRTSMCKNIMLYHPKKFPFKAIGNVQIILTSEIETKTLKLWCFVHPSIKNETLKLFLTIFDIKNWEVGAVIASELMPSIKFSFLNDSLAKFHLIGPESIQVLQRVLVPSKVSCSSHCETNNGATTTDIKINCPSMENLSSNSEISIDGKEKNNLEDRQWWKQFYNDKIRMEKNNVSNSYWENLIEPQDGAVLGLTIRDPRMVLPKKKVPLRTRDSSETKNCSISSPRNIDLPIFIGETLDKVNRSMISNHEVNELRSRLLVPGTALSLSDNESRVPVLVVGHGASLINKHGCGFDVIIPKSFSAVMWVTFALNGAVAVGQDQERTFHSELLTRAPAHFAPDTEAGREFALEQAEEKRIEYFKRPQNCRLNFIKHGITQQFSVDWLKLVQFWVTGSEDYYVLRERSKLNTLAASTCKRYVASSQENKSTKRKFDDIDTYISDQVSIPESKILKLDSDESEPPLIDSTTTNNNNREEIKCKDSKLISYDENKLKEIISSIDDCLIYVRLVIKGKGTIDDLAMICVPTAEDLLSTASENELCDCKIVEPKHQDQNAEERKTLKETHKTHLKRLRRKKKAAKDKVLSQEEDPLKKQVPLVDLVREAKLEVLEKEKDTVKQTQSYNQRMNDLWLGANEDLQICSRKMLGFVTDGRFSIRMGRSTGLGYVVAKPLLELMSKVKETDAKKQIHVLVRNQTSLQYRWARLVVLNT